MIKDNGVILSIILQECRELIELVAKCFEELDYEIQATAVSKTACLVNHENIIGNNSVNGED